MKPPVHIDATRSQCPACQWHERRDRVFRAIGVGVALAFAAALVAIGFRLGQVVP